MKRLQGKVAVVTGASRGIGAGIARRLGAEGAHVALTYVNDKDQAMQVCAEISGLGVSSTAYHVDSADAAAIPAFIDQVVEDFGALDILVSNAGVGIWKSLEEFSVEDYDITMAVNVRAVFLAAQAAARHMQEGGRIITIGSCNSERVPLPMSAVYAASKSALVGLHKGLARDLGPRGITATVVQPGPIDTAMNPADGAIADALRSIMAIPNYGAPEDIAGFVAYLASAESRFITGSALTIGGGYTA